MRYGGIERMGERGNMKDGQIQNETRLNEVRGRE